MLKIWADKWARALRSGDYKQGIGRLQTQKGGFCCLGVLCHLVGEVPAAGREHEELGTVYLFGDTCEDVVLPTRVAALTGMHSTRGYLNDRDVGVLSLAAMNDGGQSFSTIANFIESNWESL